MTESIHKCKNKKLYLELSVKAQAGKLGGLKGGKARADALTPERRKEIARKAAKTRWAKTKG